VIRPDGDGNMSATRSQIEQAFGALPDTSTTMPDGSPLMVLGALLVLVGLGLRSVRASG
jgi:hypothetical protein